MPELPEVEVVCQALKPVLEGATLVKIQLNRPDLRYPLPFNLVSQLSNRLVLSVRRRAKYLLIDFNHGHTLIWHLGMSGRIIIEDLNALFSDTSPHDHVILITSHNHKLIYRDPRRFGFLLLTHTHEIENLKPFKTIGPEPFDKENLNAQLLHDRLKSHKCTIKNALLNQKVIAGIGNIYASEALWQAKLSPLRLANTLALSEVASLLEEIQNVLEQAIIAGGSTLKDHARPNGEIGYFQRYFKAYNRENMLCDHCQLTPLKKIIQNGRATYYCPKCQL